MKLHRGNRYQSEMSVQELIEIIFGCTLAATLVGHLIINGEKPSVDGHFMSFSILAGFFAGIAFNRPVVMLIREWKSKGAAAGAPLDLKEPDDHLEDNG